MKLENLWLGGYILIISIDPGNVESGFAILNESLKPVTFGKINNEDLINILGVQAQLQKYVVIEMIANMGMAAVGTTIFETCVWIGRFKERALMMGKETNYIYRKEEKINLCGSMKAKDKNIRQALIDRFGPVGIKSNKGWFYGVSKDVWSAIAVGVTYYDMYLKGANNED